MNDYYITIDADNNVIDSFTTGFHPPEVGDICVKENQSERCWSLDLVTLVDGEQVYKYKRDESDPRGYKERTLAEIRTPEFVAEATLKATKNNIQSRQVFLFRAFSQLVTKLIAEDVITPSTCFTEDIKAEYLAIKALVDSL